ncbi:hypothetical protein [Amycolatopsis sp. NPDC059021]|uniref:hypothetical protein n=1 Tax=Amycolatopsis sp. NPDC059021 TaxID=3346704 RepID=UPI00366BAFA8
MRVHRAVAVGAAVALNVFAVGVLGTSAAVSAVGGESTTTVTAATAHGDEMGYNSVSPGEMGYN